MADGQPSLPSQPGIDIDAAELGRQRTARFGDDLLQGTERDELVLFDIGHPASAMVWSVSEFELKTTPRPSWATSSAKRPRSPVRRWPGTEPNGSMRVSHCAARPGRGQGEAGTIGRVEIIEATAQNVGTQSE